MVIIRIDDWLALTHYFYARVLPAQAHQQIEPPPVSIVMIRTMIGYE
jgi:hypothetical protein